MSAVPRQLKPYLDLQSLLSLDSVEVLVQSCRMLVSPLRRVEAGSKRERTGYATYS